MLRCQKFALHCITHSDSKSQNDAAKIIAIMTSVEFGRCIKYFKTFFLLPMWTENRILWMFWLNWKFNSLLIFCYYDHRLHEVLMELQQKQLDDLAAWLDQTEEVIGRQEGLGNHLDQVRQQAEDHRVRSCTLLSIWENTSLYRMRRCRPAPPC